MLKPKRIKRVDWIIASNLFYCQYALGEVLDKDSEFMVKLNHLVRDVFDITREDHFRAQ